MSTIARLTLADYDRMIECGVFEQRGRRRRLEFIRGEIREMAPIGSLHEVVVDILNEWSMRNLPPGRAWVRVQNSIGLPSLESAPEPDLAWVNRRDYSRGRPTAEDVLLVIEVAESTLAYDCGEKAELYAAAGIADYWVVNLPERSVEVRRDPGGGRYRSLRESCVLAASQSGVLETAQSALFCGERKPPSFAERKATLVPLRVVSSRPAGGARPGSRASVPPCS